jgi:hypothetical protein
MTYTGAEGAAAAARAAMIQAVKASGTLVRVEPEEFNKLIAKMESPLVVTATGGFFSKKFLYLTSYKGLAFFASSRTQLQLPYKAEVVAAGKIWMPQ